MRISNNVKTSLAILVLLIGLGMIVGAWWLSRPPGESASQAQARTEAEKTRQAEELQHRRDLLSKQISALISAEEEANYAAIVRGESDLRTTFRTYATRVPEFADEVMGWQSNKGITVNSIRQPCNNKTET